MSDPYRAISLLDDETVCPSGRRNFTWRWIRDAGRVPAERDTLYRIVREYGDGEDPRTELDAVEDAEARFGSYRRLIASGEFRFTQR